MLCMAKDKKLDDYAYCLFPLLAKVEIAVQVE